MSTVTTSVDEVPVVDILTATDRCDSGGCGAQAYVRVNLCGGDLDFCLHHYKSAEPGLLAAGATVTIDNRDELTAKPTL